MKRRPDGGLRAKLRALLPMVHWTTIESGFTEHGIPDLCGTHRGRVVWIECKRAKGWAFVMRPAQVSWIRRNIRAGGRVVVAVGRGKELWLVKGGAAAGGLRHDLRKLPPGAVLGTWAGRWPAPRVLAALWRGKPAKPPDDG